MGDFFTVNYIPVAFQAITANLNFVAASISDMKSVSKVRNDDTVRSTYTLQNKVIKKRSEETQTLRAGCSSADPKIFVPPQTPFPGAQDGQNLISWRWSLPLPTNPV